MMARIFLLLGLFQALAHAGDPVSITWLKQLHPAPILPNLDKNEIATSQFSLLKQLVKLRGGVIFQEGQAKDFTPKFSTRPSFSAADFYCRFDELSDTKKQMLSDLDAVRLAADFGAISLCKATDDPVSLEEDHLWLVKELKRRQPLDVLRLPEFHQRIVERRELELLRRVRDFLESPQYHAQPVVVVFSALHEFKDAARFASSFHLKTPCEAALGKTRLP